MSHKEIEKIVREEFEERKLRNKGYSQRSFAKSLGISSGALCSIMNGSRKISNSMATRLADRMCLSPKERTDFLGNFMKDDSQQKGEAMHLYDEQFHLISEWQHFAILSLLKTKGVWSIQNICHRLVISKQVSQLAVDRLIDLKLIEREGLIYKRSTSPIKTSDNVSNLALKKAHLSELSLIEKSILNDPVELRDFTSMTMAIDSKKIPAAKKRIRKFLQSMCDLLEEGSKDEVYKLGVNLYPVTKS